MHYDSVFKPGLFAGRTIIVTGGGSGSNGAQGGLSTPSVTPTFPARTKAGR